MEKRDVVDALIINNKGEFLLQKKTLSYLKSPGKWVFFGGEIEKGEEPMVTLQRELKEELGINLEKDIENIKLFKKEEYKVIDINGKYFGGYRHIFIVQVNFKVSDITLSEGAGFAFFEPAELDYVDTEELCRKTWREYLNNIDTIGK